MPNEQEVLGDLPVDHARLVDPLREVTRGERRWLLTVGLILLAVVYGNLVPKEINALGVTLTQTERTSLVIIMLAVELYYMVAFWIYAKADIAEWSHLFSEQDEVVRRNISRFYHRSQHGSGLVGNSGLDQETIAFATKVYGQPWKAAAQWYKRRILFDYWFPLAFGCATILAVTAKLSLGK